MWLELLQKAANETSIASVANELNVSRTAISLVLGNKYPAKTDKIEEKVIALYSKIDCPFLGEKISTKECQQHHDCAPPTSSPRAMRFWRKCQTCTHNTNKKGGC